jgi:hypothetical protein
VGCEMKSGQYRRWMSTCGSIVGTVRLVSRLTELQSFNARTVGEWYVENLETGGFLLLHPDRIGDEVNEMVVIAEAAQ